MEKGDKEKLKRELEKLNRQMRRQKWMNVYLLWNNGE
jgi:hypothetical protein